MTHHLHQYLENHKSSCIYCNYQQIRAARRIGAESIYNGFIRSKYLQISNEIYDFINDEIGLELPVLITNIATNTLSITEPILNMLSSRSENIHLIANLMIKVNDRNFGLNRNVPCEEKLAWISIDENKVEEDIQEYNHIILIDDVYDTGCSYEIAKAKLIEIGVNENRIDLITILQI